MRFATTLLVALASASVGGTALAQALDPAVPDTTEPAIPDTPAPAVANTTAPAVANTTAPAVPMAVPTTANTWGPEILPDTPRKETGKRLRAARHGAMEDASAAALGGLALLGISWATSLPLAALSEDGHVYAIPVVGPWLVVDQWDWDHDGGSDPAQFLGTFFAVSIVSNAVLQTAGALTAVGGGLAYAALANEPAPMAPGTTAQPRVTVMPLASNGVLGLGAAGSF